MLCGVMAHPVWNACVGLGRWFSRSSAQHVNVRTRGWVLRISHKCCVRWWPTFSSNFKRQRQGIPRGSWPSKLTILGSSGLEMGSVDKTEEWLRMVVHINLGSPHILVGIHPHDAKTCIHTYAHFSKWSSEITNWQISKLPKFACLCSCSPNFLT